MIEFVCKNTTFYLKLCIIEGKICLILGKKLPSSAWLLYPTKISW